MSPSCREAEWSWRCKRSDSGMERSFLKMLRIIARYGLVNCDAPDHRPLIEDELRRAGFRLNEITRAFEWVRELRRQPNWERHAEDLLQAPELSPGATSSGVVTLTIPERSLHFLASLREYGVLDEFLEEEVLNQLMLTLSGEVSVEDVRRTAAIAIFERQFRSGEELFGIFEEEWKLLFN